MRRRALRRSLTICHACLRVGELAVDGVVGGPESGAGVERLWEEHVPGLGEGARLGHPEQLVHGLVDEAGLLLVGCGVFA